MISHLPLQTVESHLQSARCKVEREQTRQHKDHTDTILGDLGNFCENVFDRTKTDKNVRTLYEITNHTRQELLHYLQDAFETPYWQFMLDVFLKQNVRSRSLGATVVFRVLSSFKLEVLHKRDIVRRELATSEGFCEKDLEPLLRGIDTRIAVLEDVWHKDTSEFEAGGLFQIFLRAMEETNRSSSLTEREPVTPVRTFTAWPTHQQNNAKVK